jgi:hypothetical protein
MRSSQSNFFPRLALSSIYALGILAIVASGGGGGSSSDGEGDVVEPNTPPVANAGYDVRTTLNSFVVLDGLSSTDADGDALTYSWSLSAPTGSSTVLLSATSATPRFLADVAGEFLISLTVNDGTIDSAEDTMTVTSLSSVSNLPDTGQLKCFDDLNQEINCPLFGESYYGQDAQYSTNPMILEDNGLTVTDTVTGLEWQKTGESTYNWFQASGTADPTYNPSAATDVCGNLNLDGNTDWRLPTSRELLSLANFNFGYLHPKIDIDYFPDTQALGSVYWSINEQAIDTPRVWAVGYELGYFDLYLTNEGHYVRCVRGGTWGTNDFANNGNGTITDQMSGLQWQEVTDGVARNWNEALAYCENLNLASSIEWRLPDIKELESIIDHSNSPYIDTTFFSYVGPTEYWSSTTIDGLTSVAYTVDFEYGRSGPREKATTYFSVRCIH